ncbi:MAG TPA: protein phosphatase 2C domain-containing protein [Vicinamibacterales bacterium]|nr:protein phosphatase 2C domain-containing protein [Vicinamibacterales bacterium]
MADVRTAAAAVLSAAARTHPGRVRLNNEDLPVLDAARGVFGVIDGIGGQAGGEVAAATARDVILQRLARPVGTPAERVREAIAIANNEIYRRAAASPELGGMGCVITLAIVSDSRITIGHVGDTRLYKIRPETVRKVTHDHSPVGELEDAGGLAEPEAMRHPRRHEVFRDVGTIYRDKDEQEFVDVIEEPLEPDAAILICSDGLSDMLPAATIGHVVRQHAGSPERVVEALVAAANDAGGRDNVTVVYAEMPLFAERLGRAADVALTPTEDMRFPAADAEPIGVPAVAAARPGRLRRALRAINASRATWFVAGALAGVVGALALTWYVATTQMRPPQTLIVAPDGSAPYSRISEALAASRPGDVVRVEPGVYREYVELRSGADLVARVPGTVTIARPIGSNAAVLALTGPFNARVAGIRVESDTPVDVGVRVTAPAATLDLVEITGAIRRGIDVSPASAVTVRGSRFAIPGPLLAVPDDAYATVINSVAVRSGGTGGTALSIGTSARVVLRGNVFSGYSADLIEGIGAARRAELLAGNILVPAEAAPPPVRPAPRARGAQGR